MDREIANSIFGYLETLYRINQQLIKVAGYEALAWEIPDAIMIDILQEVPRIFPISYEQEKGLFIKKSDGLMEFQNEIQYIKMDYEMILENNYDLLNRIRIIRNKYEHSMHNIKYSSSGSGTGTLMDFVFQVQQETIEVTTRELITLLIPLNDLFSKIVREIIVFARKANLENYRYYERITRFDFKDFNVIFALGVENIKKIGRIFGPF